MLYGYKTILIMKYSLFEQTTGWSTGHVLKTYCVSAICWLKKVTTKTVPFTQLMYDGVLATMHVCLSCPQQNAAGDLSRTQRNKNGCRPSCNKWSELTLLPILCDYEVFNHYTSKGKLSLSSEWTLRLQEVEDKVTGGWGIYTTAQAIIPCWKRMIAF